MFCRNLSPSSFPNLQQAICTMMSFYYYDLNPLGFGFLVQIKAFVI